MENLDNEKIEQMINKIRKNRKFLNLNRNKRIKTRNFKKNMLGQISEIGKTRKTL